MGRWKQICKNRQGITLLETVLGLALFTLAITLFSTMLTTAAQISRDSYGAEEQISQALAALEWEDASVRTSQPIRVWVEVPDGLDFQWSLVLETYRSPEGRASVRAFATPGG